MGTRNLTIVILDDEVKVSQYGQWDGYPTGQGNTIVNFILYEMNKDKFKEQLKKCQFTSKDEINKLWKECEADLNLNCESIEIDNLFRNKFPEFSGDTGAKILSLIQNGKDKLDNCYDFAMDSLFCEYGYVINMNKETLEVYKGFNTKPLNKNEWFYPLQKKHKKNNEFYPIKLWKKYSFSELKKNTMKLLEES